MNTLPRKARIQSPTDYYHVMMRGNNRERIFENNSQKTRFLDCLKEQSNEGVLDIAAYCIMDNHIHIVVKAELPNLTQDGINEANELSRFPTHLGGIIKTLLNESKLSHRKIAKLLNISSSSVYLMSVEDK